MPADEKKTSNFIEQIIEQDLKEGKHNGRVLTRFPPEPNGYLHIGHAKSIVLNFGLGLKYGGKTNLRFDDTNPVTEDTEYVESILADVRWLGYEWNGEALYASDYFDQLYAYAVILIKKGLAYVDDSSAEEIAAMKGTPTEPGMDSPCRNRSVEENLDLFTRMKAGEFKDGEKVLRAKIDMASPNMHLRDPLMYRVKHAHHHRTADKWCIYPMYDFAHGQSDSIEGITHSICTLEFENHRPLYNWFIEHIGIFPSRQIEFARLNLNYTIMSKRKLLLLVQNGHVSGWDDPRMPTLSGLRRRGYTPESIRDFAERVGIAKRENVIDVGLLEYAARDHLNKIASRVMVVMDPIKMIITNYPEGPGEMLDSNNNPEDEGAGSRQISFSRELYIERDDFMIDPPKKFFRLGPGLSTRLKDAYKVTCNDYKLDPETGEVEEIYCSYHADSKSGQDTSGIPVKSTIHWVDVLTAVDMEVRLYDRLVLDEDPGSHKDRDFLEFLNPDSLKVIQAKAEAGLKTARVGNHFQFMRMGYFCPDPDSKMEHLVFNRTVTLKDAWAKLKDK